MKISFLKILIIVLILTFAKSVIFAQGVLPGTTPKKDSTHAKTNTVKWKNEDARIYFEKLNSIKIYHLDTNINNFHQSPYTANWNIDLGNVGSPIQNLFFSPEDRTGPSLGYHVFDAYRFNVDSIKYFNTNKPYSEFNYVQGSKIEQQVGFLLSQNLKPNWNITVEYKRINSPGFYKIQRNIDDNAYLSSNYKSLDKHYSLYIGMVYNLEQHDENGGNTIDSQLRSSNYTDLRTLDAAYQNDAYSLTRSSVYNNQRDFTFLFQHSYAWGKTDTVYNEDSTQYAYQLKPIISLTHKLEISTEKHTYKDLTPDSLRYVSIFNQSFANNGTGYYIAGQDSVYAVQQWFWMDNQFLLNGFFGKKDNPLEFSAGAGIRLDQFSSSPLPTDIITNNFKKSLTSSYLIGNIKKEAIKSFDWDYRADLKLFTTGTDAGNLILKSIISKELQNGKGGFSIGFQQQINTAPYSYSNYGNILYSKTYSFTDENITKLFIALDKPKWKFSIGVNEYFMGNYIYIKDYNSDSLGPQQYSGIFSILQLWLNKRFVIGKFSLDNNFAIQQVPLNAPVNVPILLGKHQLAYQNQFFNKNLKVAVGLQVKYNTPYTPPGYDALQNRFFYQNKSNTITNYPEFGFFLNVKVKNHFRGFIMADHLLQILPELANGTNIDVSGIRNTILVAGTPVQTLDNAKPINSFYASPGILLKFGFSWILVN